MTDKRPNLRIVREGEPASKQDSPVSISPIQIKLGHERLEFEEAAQAVDTSDQRSANRLAIAGSSLIAGALDIRHLAVRHAPNAFFRGVTPGQKSAEASEVLLSSVKDSVASGDYDQKTLLVAVLDAGSELDLATEVAASVGVDATGERSKLYRTATSFVRSKSSRLTRPEIASVPEIKVLRQPAFDYLEGVDIDIEVGERPRYEGSGKKDLVVAGAVGGVLGGLLVALLVS